MMTTKNGWLGALALVALAACGGGSKNDSTTPGGGGEGGGGGGDPLVTAPGDDAPLPAIPDAPAAEPDSVLAVISLGEPQAQLTEMAGFADAVQPGVGAMVNIGQFMPMLAGAVGAPGLDGYALDRPMWVVAIDPKVSGGAAMLVFAVGDEAKLKDSVSGAADVMQAGGFAAVGPRGALRVAGPWALSNLVKVAPRKELAMVIHLRRITASYGAEMEQTLRASMGASQRPEELKIAEGMFSMLKQIDRIEGTLTASAAGGMTAAGWVVPTAKSKLAAFAAMQQPTDYAFARRLGSAWPLLIAARLDFGPFKDFFMQTATAAGGPAAEVGKVFDLIGLEHAVGLSPMGGQSANLAALIAVTDPKLVAGMLDGIMAGLAKAGPQPWDSMVATVKAGALKASGGALHEIGIAPGKDAGADAAKAHEALWGKAGMKIYLGVVGGYLTASLEKNGKAAATKLAGATAGKPSGKLGKAAEAALAGSIERKESALMLFDFPTFMARSQGKPEPKAATAPIEIGLGFADGNLSGRFHMPIDAVKAAAQMAM